MARRTLTDAWGDRWDVEQEVRSGPVPVFGPFHFRHQTGWRVIILADRPMNALTGPELLLRLETQLERDGQFHSVTRGIDIKADPDGYTSLDDGSD
jgi:hypothetical protein